MLKKLSGVRKNWPSESMELESFVAPLQPSFNRHNLALIITMNMHLLEVFLVVIQRVCSRRLSGAFTRYPLLFTRL